MTQKTFFDPQKQQKHIVDVADLLDRNKDKGLKSTLLIGAGCSKSAGIPLGDEFVEIVKKNYLEAYNKAPKKTFFDCMSALQEEQRHRLIRKYIDKSKINMTHIALACLLKHRYIDRVLTTNFDSLVIRACAMMGFIPSVYDLTSGQYFRIDLATYPAVVHLHGQGNGFVMLTTQEQVKENYEQLRPVFEDNQFDGSWIVAGFAGQGESAFKALCEKSHWNYLFWYDRKPQPESHLDILFQKPNVFFVNDYSDSDHFFVTLASTLKCFPPDLFKRPFSFLEGQFKAFAPYHLPIRGIEENLLEYVTPYFQKAKEIESNALPIMEANSSLIAGHYDIVLELFEKNPLAEHLRVSAYWAYIMKGRACVSEARKKDFLTSEQYSEAEKYFTKAKNLGLDNRIQAHCYVELANLTRQINLRNRFTNRNFEYLYKAKSLLNTALLIDSCNLFAQQNLLLVLEELLSVKSNTAEIKAEGKKLLAKIFSCSNIESMDKELRAELDEFSRRFEYLPSSQN